MCNSKYQVAKFVIRELRVHPEFIEGNYDKFSESATLRQAQGDNVIYDS